MQFKFTYLFLFLIILCLPPLCFADLGLVTWKGIYYDPIPNQKGGSQAFCNAHNLGSSIHVINKQALTQPVYTNKGIKLDRATFNIKQEHGFYLLHGNFWASGKTNGQTWEDHIFWYATKLTETGRTQGVWSSNKCKGAYLGVAIQDDNHNN